MSWTVGSLKIPLKCPDCGADTKASVMFSGDEVAVTCNSCGVVQNVSWWKYATPEQAYRIIEERKPLGLFVVDDGTGVTGIDNTDGNAWTEDFPDLTECLMWLAGCEADSTY